MSTAQPAWHGTSARTDARHARVQWPEQCGKPNITTYRNAITDMILTVDGGNVAPPGQRPARIDNGGSEVDATSRPLRI